MNLVVILSENVIYHYSQQFVNISLKLKLILYWYAHTSILKYIACVDYTVEMIEAKKGQAEFKCTEFSTRRLW